LAGWQADFRSDGRLDFRIVFSAAAYALMRGFSVVFVTARLSRQINMATEATNYAANIKQYNYVIYVDVLAHDSKSVVDYVRRAHLECSSKRISPSLWRVLFQPGTELGDAQMAMRRFDELRLPEADIPGRTD
jgi:hypothetical protein